MGPGGRGRYVGIRGTGLQCGEIGPVEQFRWVGHYGHGRCVQRGAGWVGQLCRDQGEAEDRWVGQDEWHVYQERWVGQQDWQGGWSSKMVGGA